ncbi:trypsin-like peptidase domain-containing protein [Actinomycetospora sp. TBRC 11914]|uniref:trypsin-like peptidase domain-containing protein n=1 Tax=Actinomycetospora sp. TBRC 11914 TaxID=2729387 RepID=UPI00145EB365|nr:trypsin-like peptidase domain-containing protein [Actinomycetospora sp. TBRC 11914]NMO88808.1 PDZ domain-containing protein [Actinomycetospora sp. TBRC 11914]
MSSPWSRHATTERPGAPDEDAESDAPPDDPTPPEAAASTNGHRSNGHARPAEHPDRVEQAGPEQAGQEHAGPLEHAGPASTDTDVRPLDDGEMAAAFGRPPDGHTPRRDHDTGHDTGDDATAGAGTRRRDQAGSREPSVALASAFGRPQGAPETLQRPAEGHAPAEHTADDLWDAETTERDPWRDPAAPVELGAPAVREAEPGPDRRGTGPRLSARELLFGRRVAPGALVLLAVVALLVGAVGGVVGHLTAEGSDTLIDPGATLAQVDAGKERPAGSVSDVAGRVVPAVVSIEVRSGTTGGTGSGVVIDPRGDIVTNNHVVSLAATDPRATLEAVFSSGQRATARIVGRDPQTDIAVVKVDVANPTVAQLGRSSDLRVGDGVIAIGSPLGLAGTVTTGIVSALRRPVRLDAESADANPVIDAIQTDAAINPGNSGGALVDSTGAVVGINTAIRTLGGTDSSGQGGSIGLGFAIPIDDVRTIAQSLIQTGGFAHTDLGVNAKSVTDGTSDGAQILNVRQGGPADRAGVLEGDVVTRVDDRPIASADELTVAIREHRPGETVTLGVVRGGRPLSLQAQL